ncbi:MAG: deoxyguanosinetriphosphate triphosphohydrolase, partial [Thermodesulfobacteriota bacterium]
MKNLRTYKEIETENLADYGVRSAGSKGRSFPEEEHPFRTAFQRDRDRIIHSHAFRRLEYKTQVFVFHEGDHYRTRLTHTIEVAQIARTIARALRINEDLAEAIALAHDLGHPPFGHTGEEVLHEHMKDLGGFEHNCQSLRIVEQLERRYPNFRGLNLTYEVREGIIKHSSEYDHADVSGYEKDKFPSLEAQIVDIADEIAYNNHDIDDGLTSKMITVDMLSDVELWRNNFEKVKALYPHEDFKVHKSQTIVRIINQQVTNLIDETLKNIEAYNISCAEDVNNCEVELASFSKEIEKKGRKLKKFLMDHLYRHYRVIRMADKA